MGARPFSREYQLPTDLCGEMERLFQGLGQYAAHLQVQQDGDFITITRRLYDPYNGVPADAPLREESDTSDFIYSITHRTAEAPDVFTTIDIKRSSPPFEHAVVRRGNKGVKSQTYFFKLLRHEEESTAKAALQIAREGIVNTSEPEAAALPWSALAGSEAADFYSLFRDALQQGYGIAPHELRQPLIAWPDVSTNPPRGDIKLTDLAFEANPIPDPRIPGARATATAVFEDNVGIFAEAYYGPERTLAALAIHFAQGEKAEPIVMDAETRLQRWAALAEQLQPDHLTFTAPRRLDDN